jgi:hypothetical protein
MMLGTRIAAALKSLKSEEVVGAGIVSFHVPIEDICRHTSVGKVAKDDRGHSSHWWSYDFARVEDLLPLFGE